MSALVVFGNLRSEFPRMALAVANAMNELPKPIVVQAGPNVHFFSGAPSDVTVFDYCSATDFARLICGAELIITHSGFGTTKAAILAGRRPFCFVRAASRAEHIDDHQREWCDWLLAKKMATEVVEPDLLMSVVRGSSWVIDDREAAQRLFDESRLRAAVHSFIRDCVARQGRHS